MKYLQRLHLSYYVRVKVPPSLQKIVGNTHVRKALHTRSLDEANQLKWPMIARIKRELEKLKTSDTTGDKASTYREAIKEARDAEDYDSMETLELLASDHAEEIHKATASLAKAQAWYALATTESKTLGELLDDWLESSEYTTHTKDKHTKAFQELIAYLGGDCLPSAVTDRVAIAYVDSHLKPQKLGNKTKAGKVGSLAAFWKWMGRKLHIPKGFNPWHGHELATKIDLKRNPNKRPYTAAELVALLSGFQGSSKGKNTATVASLVLLGLYSGARLEELCRLTVDDLDEVDGAFFARVIDSKTEAGKREWAAADFKDTLLRCETGGGSWLQDGSSAGNSRLKRSSWSPSAA